MPTAPGPHGDVVDPREDLPMLARARACNTQRRCLLCGQRIAVGDLILATRRFTRLRHAACVRRAQRGVADPGTRPTRPGLRVAVCGGRSYADAAYLERCLNQVPVAVLAHGGATGADFLAGRWARRHEVPVTVFEAEWGRYGNRAGPIRNSEMLSRFRPQLLLAFAGGVGTADCVGKANEARIPVWETYKATTLVRALAPSSPSS